MQGNGQSELGRSSGGKDQSSGHSGFVWCAVGFLDTPPTSRTGTAMMHESIVLSH